MKLSELKALTEAQAANRKTISEETPDHRKLYANSVTLGVSPWDIALRFGLLAEASVEVVKTADHTTIYMSPQHAKAFLTALDQNIKAYEQAFGEIPDPTSKLGIAAEK